MKQICVILAGVASLALAACGGSTPANPEDAGVKTPTAEEVAAAESADVYFDPALTRPSCPANIPADKYAGPDLLGLKLGMTIPEALAVAWCDRKDFHVESGPSFLNVDTRGEKLGPQTITLRDGKRRECTSDESMNNMIVPGMSGGNAACRNFGQVVFEESSQTIHVAAPGRPGQERVMGIWRSQTYADNAPTFEANVATLIERFGQPGLRLDQGSRTILYWPHDVSGALLTSDNPLASECGPNLDPGYKAAQRWSDGCGLTIAALVNRADENQEIAKSYTVGITNQRELYLFGDAMEKHYADVEAAARAAEIDKAKNAAAPEL